MDFWMSGVKSWGLTTIRSPPRHFSRWEGICSSLISRVMVVLWTPIALANISTSNDVWLFMARRLSIYDVYNDLAKIQGGQANYDPAGPFQPGAVNKPLEPVQCSISDDFSLHRSPSISFSFSSPQLYLSSSSCERHFQATSFALRLTCSGIPDSFLLPVRPVTFWRYFEVAPLNLAVCCFQSS